MLQLLTLLRRQFLGSKDVTKLEKHFKSFDTLPLSFHEKKKITLNVENLWSTAGPEKATRNET